MPNRFIEQLKRKIKRTTRKVEDLRWNLLYKRERNTSEKHFQANVERDRADEQNRRAEAFSAEFLDFIFTDISGTLARLNPTEGQVDVFYHLKDGMSQEAEGTVDQLVLKDTIMGKYKPTGEYFIGKTFSAGSQKSEPTANAMESLLSMMQEKYSSLHMKWSVDRGYPIMGEVYGRSGVEMLNSIGFLFFEKIPNDLEVEKTIGSYVNEKVTARVLENGKRISVIHEFNVQGKTEAHTFQYYALGSFEGSTTEQNYIVYGTNEGNKSERQVQKQNSTSHADVFTPAMSRT